MTSQFWTITFRSYNMHRDDRRKVRVNVTAYIGCTIYQSLTHAHSCLNLAILVKMSSNFLYSVSPGGHWFLSLMSNQAKPARYRPSLGLVWQKIQEPLTESGQFRKKDFYAGLVTHKSKQHAFDTHKTCTFQYGVPGEHFPSFDTVPQWELSF